MKFSWQHKLFIFFIINNIKISTKKNIKSISHIKSFVVKLEFSYRKLGIVIGTSYILINIFYFIKLKYSDNEYFLIIKNLKNIENSDNHDYKFINEIKKTINDHNTFTIEDLNNYFNKDCLLNNKIFQVLLFPVYKYLNRKTYKELEKKFNSLEFNSDSSSTSHPLAN